MFWLCKTGLLVDKLNNNKKITIITVCFNSENYIENCICSVLSQNYNNIEYIVIDGNSKDRTLQIINRYESKIDLILSKSDLGMYDAMNKGILRASGDYIAFLNSDDFYTSEFIISKKMNFILKNNLDLTYSNVLFSKKKDINFIVRKYNSFFFHPFLLRFGIMPAHPSTIIKKDLFLNLGLFNLDYFIASDFDLILKIFKNKKIKFRYMNINSVLMRIGGKSNKNFLQILKLNNEILNSLKKNSVKSSIFLLLLKFPFKIFEYHYFFISLFNFFIDSRKDLYTETIKRFKNKVNNNNFTKSL